MTRAVITHGPRPGTAETEPDVDMTTWLAGLELPSPVLTASGCAAAGRESTSSSTSPRSARW